MVFFSYRYLCDYLEDWKLAYLNLQGQRHKSDSRTSYVGPSNTMITIQYSIELVAKQNLQMIFYIFYLFMTISFVNDAGGHVFCMRGYFSVTNLIFFEYQVIFIRIHMYISMQQGTESQHKYQFILFFNNFIHIFLATLI